MEGAIGGRNNFCNLGVHVCSAGRRCEAAVRSEVGAARRKFDAVLDASIADRAIAQTLAGDREQRDQQKKRRQEPSHA